MTSPRVWAIAAMLVAGAASGQSRRVTMPCFLPPTGACVAHDEPDKKDHHATPATPELVLDGFTMVNLHTHEAVVLDVEPARNESVVLRRLLRDRTTWEEHAMDATSMATVRAAAVEFGTRRVEVISGYRSDKLNEHLRKKGHHVAQHSQHVLGTAIDFRLVGTPMEWLRDFLELTHVGGIGIYRDNAFIHVDTGPVRRWTGE